MGGRRCSRWPRLVEAAAGVVAGREGGSGGGREEDGRKELMSLRAYSLAIAALLKSFRVFWVADRLFTLDKRLLCHCSSLTAAFIGCHAKTLCWYCYQVFLRTLLPRSDL